jgi:hypothetical protein
MEEKKWEKENVFDWLAETKFFAIANTFSKLFAVLAKTNTKMRVEGENCVESFLCVLSCELNPEEVLLS